MGPAFPFVKYVLTPRGHAGRRRRPPKVSGPPARSAAEPPTPATSTVSTACRPPATPTAWPAVLEIPPGGKPRHPRRRPATLPGRRRRRARRIRPTPTAGDVPKHGKAKPARPPPGRMKARGDPPGMPGNRGVDVGSWPFWRSPRRRGPSNSPASTACDAPDRRHGRQLPKTKRGAFAPRRRCRCPDQSRRINSILETAKR